METKTVPETRAKKGAKKDPFINLSWRKNGKRALREYAWTPSLCWRDRCRRGTLQTNGCPWLNPSAPRKPEGEGRENERVKYIERESERAAHATHTTNTKHTTHEAHTAHTTHTTHSKHP